MPMQQNQN